ncbi:Glutamate synthase [NADPH] large chain (EC [Olavius sp. associated proteobacterium Delta 1]|nr:Glutamate synthase [NADPH] large chain (EC [Olavius sp. associated proteobacterium Delta 1]
MAKYICSVCEYVHDEEKSSQKWDGLADEWVCPVCDSAKNYFSKTDAAEFAPAPIDELVQKETDAPALIDLQKTMAEAEPYFADIQEIARSSRTMDEPMRTKEPVISWDEVLIKGAQLARFPLYHEEPVNTKTVIGPGAGTPLVIETPIYISHMSFGALSKEAKTALAKGSAALKTLICSGEGGILPEEFDAAYRYIFEYVPNQYSVNEENLRKVDAIEIKIGQSAKPGLGGHLPGKKVTSEIARLRGFKEGEDIISPSHFKDIRNKEDLKNRVDWLRETSGGKPVGIKLAAGNIEDDLEFAVFAGPDFITIDGRAGATGSAPKFVKASTSIPTLFAVYRARKYLDQNAATDISLTITGGLRISSDFAKALALGADTVAISTSALIAIGCQQYRVCNTGKCPMGIATQDPELRRRLDIDQAAGQLENFLRVSTEELKDFARLTGNDDIHKLSIHDLCTTNSEISDHTEIEHV